MIFTNNNYSNTSAIYSTLHFYSLETMLVFRIIF